MKTVLCFGEALIDFLVVDQIETDGLELPSFRQYPGGAPANAAVAVAKLGGLAQFAGQVGDDMFGHFLVNALQHYGVDTGFVSQHPSAKTPLAFVKLDSQGERRFSFHRDKSADLLLHPNQVSELWFKDQPLFHFCSNTLTDEQITATTQAAIKAAKGAGCLVSFDVNLRHNLWPQQRVDVARVNALVEQADMVKFAKEELEYLAAGKPQAYIDHCLNQGCQLLIVTDGPNAIDFYNHQGQATIMPPKVDVVDTTAGGDAFIGGLLYALSQFEQPKTWLTQIESLKQLIPCAATCGGFAVGRAGAFVALPSQQDVINFNPCMNSVIEQLKCRSKT